MYAAACALALGLLSGLGATSDTLETSGCEALATDLEAHREALGIVWQSKGPEIAGHSVPDWVKVLAEHAASKSGDAHASSLSFGSHTPHEGAALPLSQSRRLPSAEAANETCKDDRTWVDAQRWPCWGWQGFSCDPYPGYSEAEMEEVRQKCPETCHLCDHQIQSRYDYSRLTQGLLQGLLATHVVVVSLVTCASVYFSRHWWAHLIARILRCKHQEGSDSRGPRSSDDMDMIGPTEWQFAEYVRKRKGMFRRQYARVPAVLSVFLATERLSHALSWAIEQPCPHSPLPGEMIMEVSEGVRSLLLAILLLPRSVLGRRGDPYNCIMLAFHLMFAGTQALFQVNTLVNFLYLFKHSMVRLSMLVCLDFKAAVVVCIVQFVWLQSCYMWSIGATPMVTFPQGRCIDLQPMSEGIGVWHFLSMSTNEVSPWRCLFLNSCVTVLLLVCLAMIDSLLESTMQSQAQLVAVESHQTALMSIMRATCDCIVYLDKNLTICAPSPKLSALLLHGNGQQTSVIGRNLRELMASEDDWQRLRAMMSPQSERLRPDDTAVDGKDKQVSHVVHVSLRDALGTPLNVQCFWAQFTDLRGETLYTLGITEESETSLSSSLLSSRQTPGLPSDSRPAYRGPGCPESPDSMEEEATLRGGFGVTSRDMPAIGDQGLLSIPEGSCITPSDSGSELSACSAEGSQGEVEPAMLVACATFPFQVLEANKSLRTKFFKGKVVPRNMGLLDSWLCDRSQATEFSKFVCDKINSAFYLKGPWPMKLPFGVVDVHPPTGKLRRKIALEVELDEPDKFVRDNLAVAHYSFAVRLVKYRRPATDIGAVEQHSLTVSL
eukprot:gb/GFBE01032839.1/.p1 GENE.gb/GFBE01032839.1/~~gb/GFBE01032839.1/.p1  ORF type:complete len:833 (+),score=121.10 gb/GFBE01032839.1/:1-2499(+)